MLAFIRVALRGSTDKLVAEKSVLVLIDFAAYLDIFRIDVLLADLELLDRADINAVDLIAELLLHCGFVSYQLRWRHRPALLVHRTILFAIFGIHLSLPIHGLHLTRRIVADAVLVWQVRN